MVRPFGVCACFRRRVDDASLDLLANEPRAHGVIVIGNHVSLLMRSKPRRGAPILLAQSIGPNDWRRCRLGLVTAPVAPARPWPHTVLGTQIGSGIVAHRHGCGSQQVHRRNREKSVWKPARSPILSPSMGPACRHLRVAGTKVNSAGDEAVQGLATAAPGHSKEIVHAEPDSWRKIDG